MAYRFAILGIIGLLIALGCTKEKAGDGRIVRKGTSAHDAAHAHDHHGHDHDHHDHDHDHDHAKPAPPRADEATSLWTPPVLTGDREKDKASLAQALATVEAEWTANSAAYDKLSADKSVSPDDPRFEAFRAKDVGLRQALAEIHALIDAQGKR